MGETCSTYRSDQNAYRILVGKLEVRHHSEDKGVDRRLILKWILRK
jgi:hypothetical protein